MASPIEENRDILEVFSPGIVEYANKEIRPIFPDLVDKLTTDIYGFAYRRSALKLETRHLISLGVLAAMGDCSNQLEFQLRAALNIGLSVDEIKEVFIQVSVFCGNARAMNSAIIFNRILESNLNASDAGK